MADDSIDGTGGEPAPDAQAGHSNRTVTPAIAAALVVLAASFALSVAFILANGGLDLPAAQRATSSPGPGAMADASRSPSPTSSAAPAGPSAAPSPTDAIATPTPRASSSPSPRPSSNRYELLTACPDTPSCWVYVVREGDNLFSIAHYFGVPLAVVQDRNPWTKTTTLAAGQKLLLPPPTR